MSNPSSKLALSSRSFSNISGKSRGKDLPFHTSAFRFHFYRLSKAENAALKDKHYARGTYWVESSPETTEFDKIKENHLDLSYLTTEDITTHWRRLVGNRFPVDDLHNEVSKLRSNEEISDEEFDYWRDAMAEYDRQVKIAEWAVNNSGEYIEQEELDPDKAAMQRQYFTEMVAWMMAIDIRVGFPAVADFVKGFGHLVVKFENYYDYYRICVGRAIEWSRWGAAMTALQADVDLNNDVLVILLLDDLSTRPEVFSAKLHDELINEFEDNYECLLKQRIPGSREVTPMPPNRADNDPNDHTVKRITVILLVKNLKTPLEPHEIRYSNVTTSITDFRKRLETMLNVHAADRIQLREENTAIFRQLENEGVDFPHGKLENEANRVLVDRHFVRIYFDPYRLVEWMIEKNRLTKVWHADYRGLVKSGLTSEEAAKYAQFSDMTIRFRELFDIRRTVEGLEAFRIMGLGPKAGGK